MRRRDDVLLAEAPHVYCGTMPLKLNRSSKVKSVPETASVRCAEETRRTRRSDGNHTQVSSFFVVAFGPSHRHHVVRLDPHHHRCVFEDGFVFEIAVWDWPIWARWCWDCGEDFVVYEDPDHDGWYLLYDVHTGGYVHALFMGSS